MHTIQALWQTLHNPDDSIAQVAFRVLGKFGGSNRKMLTTPQQLEYRDTLVEGPSISLSFPDTEGPIELPVAKVRDCESVTGTCTYTERYTAVHVHWCMCVLICCTGH